MTEVSDATRPKTRKPTVATNSSEQKYAFALEFLGNVTPGMLRPLRKPPNGGTLVDTAADWTPGSVRIRSSAFA